MRARRSNIFAFLCALPFVPARRPTKREYATHDYYVFEHDPRADSDPGDVAQALGLQLVEPLGELPNTWVARQLKPSDEPETTRRQMVDISERDTTLLPAVRYLERQVPARRTKRDGIALHSASHVLLNGTDVRSVALHFNFTDPNFADQWHLVNEDFPEHSMNATGVWDMGITGEGVVTALVDDGLDYSSDDLAPNFDVLGSHDFNDHTELPTPRLVDDTHGTRCAGEIAAAPNNACGIGLAYNSKVAGLRILSGEITDMDEATAVNFGYQNTSIYSCSWGPPDDGRHMEGPAYIVEKAFVNGVTNGRGGRGSVFVFASGNGASAGDQCNFDGFTNSIFTTTIAGIDWRGEHPYYSESCAANMVVAYTSGGGKSITSTDVGKNRCASTHGGTSAAAPNAAGVFALALSARPELTWRDIQHLCVRTAQMVDPTDSDWEPTAAGRPFNYKYGYGKLDAYHFVTAALAWPLVKPQAWLAAPPVRLNDGRMDADGTMSGGVDITPGGIASAVVVTEEMVRDHNLDTLEHVTVRVWIAHDNRGDVEVELVSPRGVRSVLAVRRARDSMRSGFQGWRFMSLKHWDEDPVGEWQIRVSDQDKEDARGKFLGWSLTLFGSAREPTQARPYEVDPSATVLSEYPVRLPSSTSTSTAHQDTSTVSGDEAHPHPGTSHTALTPEEAWAIVGIAALAVAGVIGMTVFLARRRRGGALYSTLATEEGLDMEAIEQS